MSVKHYLGGGFWNENIEIIYNRSSSYQHTYNYHPKTNDELKKLVKKLIKERGNDADLNDIDTSDITDMSYVFFNSAFNGDISERDVSNVKDMYVMFYASKFNGDISKWDVSNVTNMDSMFVNSPLENNPPKWYRQ